jgi:hypothetical protein
MWRKLTSKIPLVKGQFFDCICKRMRKPVFRSLPTKNRLRLWNYLKSSRSLPLHKHCFRCFVSCFEEVIAFRLLFSPAQIWPFFDSGMLNSLLFGWMRMQFFVCYMQFLLFRCLALLLAIWVGICVSSLWLSEMSLSRFLFLSMVRFYFQAHNLCDLMTHSQSALDPWLLWSFYWLDALFADHLLHCCGCCGSQWIT